jgi:hypothetical protein
MQSKIITYNELIKSNKTLCLSALRGLGKCFKCKQYISCESKIKHEQYDRLLNYKQYLQIKHNKQIAIIDKSINSL